MGRGQRPGLQTVFAAVAIYAAVFVLIFLFGKLCSWVWTGAILPLMKKKGYSPKEQRVAVLGIKDPLKQRDIIKSLQFKDKDA